MQSPVSYDICIFRESKFSECYTFTDDNNAPVNMTGWRVYAQLRETQDRSSDLLAEFTVSMMRAHEGVINLSLPSEVTASFIPRLMAYYDMMCVDLQGIPRYFVKGRAMLHSTVTTLISQPSHYYTERDAMFVCAISFFDNRECASPRSYLQEVSEIYMITRGE